MNRKTLSATLAAVAIVGLAGCVSTAPPATFSAPPVAVPTTAPAPPAPAPAEPVTTTHQPDESAYLAALSGGTDPAGIIEWHAELRAATLEAGYGACSIIDMATSPEVGMLQVLGFAEQHLSGDPFTADMPALFTSAAAVHLCGVTP